MTADRDQTEPRAKRTIISVDAMGGDLGPGTVVAGVALSAHKNDEIGFILHGRRDVLEPLVARRRNLAGRCEIRDAPEIVAMDEKPSQVMRRGRETSMWSALESVRSGEATVCVSCGNTGALLLMSVVRLRKLPGILPAPPSACCGHRRTRKASTSCSTAAPTSGPTPRT